MEKELNYLSEKLVQLEERIDTLQEDLRIGNGCSGRIGEEYRLTIKSLQTEKQHIENILSILTNLELNKQS